MTTKPQAVEFEGRDVRIIRHALWVQGHVLLNGATAMAQKTSEAPIAAVRSCMDDGNRLLEISAAIDRGSRVTVQPIEVGE